MTELYTPAVPRLDLGSGPTPAEGYVGVDECGGPGVLWWDFLESRPWPFAAESIEALHSSHFIEHLPFVRVAGRDALVRFMEEAYRVAKLGAEFVLRWPVPFHPVTGAPIERAWWDPTHARQIPMAQMLYFSEYGRRHHMGVAYPWRCNWVLTEETELRTLGSPDSGVLEYRAVLRKESLE